MTARQIGSKAMTSCRGCLTGPPMKEERNLAPHSFPMGFRAKGKRPAGTSKSFRLMITYRLSKNSWMMTTRMRDSLRTCALPFHLTLTLKAN